MRFEELRENDPGVVKFVKELAVSASTCDGFEN